MIRLHIDRDSVHAGDDAHSHAQQFELEDDATLEQLMSLASPDASVSGGACWVLYRGNEPLGVLGQDWPKLRMVDPSLTRVAQLATDGAVSLHFWYALQADPDVMLEIVSTGSPNRTQAWDAYFARLDDAAAEAARRDAYVEPGKFFSADTRAALEGVGFTITETSESAALELEGERFEVRWDERTEPGLPARMIRVGAEASDDPLAFHAWASAGDDAARIVMQLAGEARRARRGLSAYRWPKDFRVTELVEHHWGYRWEYGGLARIVDFGWQKDAVARFIAISATPLTDAAAFYNPDER